VRRHRLAGGAGGARRRFCIDAARSFDSLAGVRTAAEAPPLIPVAKIHPLR
jgi:hypothetical protein